MKKSIVLILFVFLLILSLELRAQDKKSSVKMEQPHRQKHITYNTQYRASGNVPNKKSKFSKNAGDTKYAFGISLSMFSGVGFSFDYKYSYIHRLKFVEYFYYNNDDEEAYILMSSVEWQHDLQKYRFGRFYYFFSFGAYYKNKPWIEKQIGFYESEKKYSIINGAAVGFEFYGCDTLSMYFDFGIKANFDHTYNDKISYGLGLAFGGGVSYGF